MLYGGEGAQGRVKLEQRPVGQDLERNLFPDELCAALFKIHDVRTQLQFLLLSTMSVYKCKAFNTTISSKRKDRFMRV